ncbi:glycosyltransferase [Lacticaseibacillus paracasei]
MHAYLVVLYRQEFDESVAFTVILEHAKPSDVIFVYDNSPLPRKNVPEDQRIQYIHDSQNSGLAVAYNYVANECIAKNIQWLTIFDQDTQIPLNFFITIEQAISNSHATCIVPKVILGNNEPLSPFFIEDRLFIRTHVGSNKTLAAINSGVTVDLTKLKQIGSSIFDNSFPLDFLDYSFFLNLARHQCEINQMGSTIIQDLSVTNFKTMSFKRFQSFVLAESRFVNLYYPERKREYHVRVVLRAIKAMLKGTQRDKVELMWRVGFGGRN